MLHGVAVLQYAAQLEADVYKRQVLAEYMKKPEKGRINAYGR